MGRAARLARVNEYYTAFPDLAPNPAPLSESLSIQRGELRVAAVLGAVFFLRMLGLFMLVPVLALYAGTLAGASPLLIGLAIGVYGLTQAACQIPLGALSDRVGRRPVIAGGLVLFAGGALLAASAQHVLPVILGRALQGTGAVSGATLALASDHSRDSQRTKVMAIIGISIGGAFSLAFVIGPMLNAWLGLSGLFAVTAVLALAALPLLLAVPEPPVERRAVAPWRALAAPGLRGLYLGVFGLHLLLAASFVAIPVQLREGMGIAPADHYLVYLPVLLTSFVLVGPLVMASARTRLARHALYASIAALGLAELLLWISWADAAGTIAGLVLFFTAFNYLEASLPGIVSREAPAGSRGAALGAFATCQFLGMFAGGLAGGALAQLGGFEAVPLGCAALATAWFGASLAAPAGADGAGARR